MQPEIAQSIFTMMLNTSFALVIGSLASSFLLSNERNQNWLIKERLAWATKLGIALCVASTLLSLWQTSATMGDVPLLESGPTLWRMFAVTHYGSVGLVSVGLLIVSGLSTAAINRRQPNSAAIIICLIALALYALCRVSVSHAYESGFISIAVLVEWVHLVAMGMWVGLVLTAAWIVLPMLRSTKAGYVNTVMYLSSLSTWATFVLLAILATGFYNGFRVLNTPRDLVATQYGWILVVKLVFVALAIALGGWNRFYGFPKASTSARLENWYASLLPATVVLQIESIALLIVLAAAAVLTGSAPPASM